MTSSFWTRRARASRTARRARARRRAPPPAPARPGTPVSPARRARPLPRQSYGRRQLLADDLVHQFAVRPALELRHDLSHDLSDVLGPRGDRLPHGAPDLLGIDRGGEELLERPHLAELRRRPGGAPRGGVLLGRLAAGLDAAAHDPGRPLIGDGVLELEFAVLEVCEDGGEEERAPLIAVFAGLVHRGAEPLGQARHVRPGARAGFYGAPRPSFACVARSALRDDGACTSRPGSRLLVLWVTATDTKT